MYQRRVFAVLSILLGAALAWGQVREPDKELPPNPAPAQKQSGQDQPVTTLKRDVNVVNLFFNVKDKNGGLIPDLTKDDFQVFEDGKPQTIKYFSKEADQPLTLGILIDSSVSQMNVLPMEKDVGYDFLKQVVRDKDLAFVISFDVNVDLLQDLTNSTKLLHAGLESAKINDGGGGGGLPGMGGGPFPSQPPRGTLLFDAVYLGAHDELASQVGRKAMILLTDGEDQGSRTPIREAIEAAQRADVICYVIMIADRGFYSSHELSYEGGSAMGKLAQQTGGRVIEVGNKVEKLRQAFDQIGKELRTQYSIGYTPTNNRRDGTFRRVEIKTANKDFKIQSRSGYYAPKTED